MTDAGVIRTVEILDVTEDEGMHAHRYRVTVTGARKADGAPIPDTSFEGFAHTPVEPVARDVLLDRWAALMADPHGDPTEAQDNLDKMLRDLAEGVVRRDLEGNAIVGGADVALDLVIDIDGLEEVIRDWFLDRAAAIATPAGGHGG